MISLFNYCSDGACASAKAVLGYLQQTEGIDASWSNKEKRYLALPTVSRWENCREQGYIISMRSKDHMRQINIAFFEHRNSDSICAVEWEQVSLNSIGIENAEFGDGVYKDKFDVSHKEGYGDALKMADWIMYRLEEFWRTTKNNKQKDENNEN